MTPQEIATRMHEMLNKIQFGEAQKELFSDDVASIEPPHSQTGLPTVRGKAAAMAKGASFRSMVKEWHHVFANEPMVYGPYIFIEMGIDVTLEGAGRINLKEMCKYEVKDGKIISEEYFHQ
jgi:limonene-1,2-epoxide hydrolase